MKKLALLHFAYSPHIGGVEILLREQADILSVFGYDVFVLTGSGQNKNPKVRLKQIPQFQSVMNFDSALQDKILEKQVIDEDFYHLSAKIEKILEENLKDREIVIVHNMLTVFRNLPFTHAFKKFAKNHPDKKYIIWVHDHMYTRCGGANYSIKDRNKIEKDLLIKPIPNANYVVISTTFKKLLTKVMEVKEDHVTVIPDGVNIKSFLEIDDSIWQIYQKLNLLDRFPIILSPVNILPRKNIEYSLKIVAKLKKKYPDLVYLISGKPSQHRDTTQYLDSIKKLIDKLDLRKDIIFLSDYFDHSMHDSEIHDLYTLADFVFYFSKAENFGLPVVESYLSKTPIFVSDLKVFHEVGGDNLYYIDWRNLPPEKAANIILDFISSNKTIQLNSRMRQRYSLWSMIKNLLIPLFDKGK